MIRRETVLSIPARVRTIGSHWPDFRRAHRTYMKFQFLVKRMILLMDKTDLSTGSEAKIQPT